MSYLLGRATDGPVKLEGMRVDVICLHKNFFSPKFPAVLDHSLYQSPTESTAGSPRTGGAREPNLGPRG